MCSLAVDQAEQLEAEEQAQQLSPPFAFLHPADDMLTSKAVAAAAVPGATVGSEPIIVMAAVLSSAPMAPAEELPHAPSSAAAEGQADGTTPSDTASSQAVAPNNPAAGSVAQLAHCHTGAATAAEASAAGRSMSDSGGAPASPFAAYRLLAEPSGDAVQASNLPPAAAASLPVRAAKRQHSMQDGAPQRTNSSPMPLVDRSAPSPAAVPRHSIASEAPPPSRLHRTMSPRFQPGFVFLEDSVASMSSAEGTEPEQSEAPLPTQQAEEPLQAAVPPPIQQVCVCACLTEALFPINFASLALSICSTFARVKA